MSRNGLHPQVPVSGGRPSLRLVSTRRARAIDRLVSQIEQGWWKEVPLTCYLAQIVHSMKGQKRLAIVVSWLLYIIYLNISSSWLVFHNEGG